MKICAVVVTYNRKDLLVECLEALRRQTGPLDAIYIIDNASTDGTPELLRSRGYRDGAVIENPLDGSEIIIRYVRLPVNTGGAGGFHEGVKRAFHDGYDWIWLMDDDVEPEEYTLEKLLRASERIPEDISAVAPVRFFQGSLFNRETRPSTSEIP